MRITNRAGLSVEALAALENELPEHGTLLQVIAWCNAQRPPLTVAEIIRQDEYTHDLVIPWKEALTLVYGAT